MNSKMNFGVPRLAFAGLFAIVLLLAFAARASVTFNVSPSSVSNTYFGIITLQITGLTNTETVVVQKYLDANNNGVIDSGDLLVQQYQLTDGQAAVFSGVTNYYVPGDLNPAPGAITTFLGFVPAAANGDISQQLNANYLYKLSSPSGHFSPITNAFTVTSFPFPQTVSGVVYSNNSVAPNSVVILFNAAAISQGLYPLYGTVADGGGNYSIPAPPGSYLPIAFVPGCLASGALTPTVTITTSSGAANLYLTNATQTISGQLQDANDPSIGLPGVFMSANSSAIQIGSGFTDTSGNFVLGAAPGSWKIGFEAMPLHALGYLGPQSSYKVNTSSGSVNGLALGLPKEQAIFYGTILDASNNPLPGVRFTSSDMTGDYEDEGSSFVSGNYYAAALTNGPWSVSVDGYNPAYTNYMFSVPQVQLNGGTNLTAGQACQINFVGVIATNTISGSVKDNNNNPITNVQVYAYGNVNGTGFQPEANTDTNGHYSINVAPGTWTVNVYCGGGQNSLPSNYQCPNSVTVTVTNNNNIVMNFVVQPCGGLQIVTTNLPVGEVNVPYNQFVNASSCSFVNWTNIGGGVPPGITFTGSGDLTGTPSASGLYMFTVQATDGNNNTTNRQLSLTINNGVLVTTTNLPNATNGLFYSQTLQAGNGVAFSSGSAYEWSLSPGSASLPIGLTLNPSGMISGNPSTNGTFNFFVRATDELGGTSDRSLSLTIVSGGPVGTPPPIAVGSYPGGQIFVLYPSAAGTGFALQMTTNLTSGPWIPVTNGVPATGFLFTNNLPAVYYRLH